MIKKADIILFIVLLAAGLFCSWWISFGNSQGDRVIVTVDGALYGTYELSEDQEIDISHDDCQNHITIKNGTVQMTSSTCKNQVCVDHSPISETKDSIICLPNKVVVEIEKAGGDVDVISG